MSLNSKIIDIIDKRIQEFGNFQTQINKSANQSNSGVDVGTFESFDPKSGTGNVRTNTGKLIKNVQPSGSGAFGNGSVGIVLGNTFRT